MSINQLHFDSISLRFFFPLKIKITEKKSSKKKVNYYNYDSNSGEKMCIIVNHTQIL